MEPQSYIEDSPVSTRTSDSLQDFGQEPCKAGRMYVLVVCGATDSQHRADAAMFSDFMGICMTFKLFEEECTGTFLSCFPVEAYFTTLGNPQKFKFGKYGAEQQPLFEYDYDEWKNEPKVFTHVEDRRLLPEIVMWLKTTARTAVSGDYVNIFVQCHGNQYGDLFLGDSTWMESEAAEALSHFVPGVQVNCIGSHCYSGFLADSLKANGTKDPSLLATDGLLWSASRSVSNRVRNHQSALPFVSSLAKCKLPGIEQITKDPINVQNLENWVKSAIRNIAPGNGQATMQSETQVQLRNLRRAAIMHLEDLVLTQNVDVVRNLSIIHRRRRTEWPLLDQPILRYIEHPVPLRDRAFIAVQQVRSHVYATYKETMTKNEELACDNKVETHMRMQNPDYDMLISELYLRGRFQSTVWDVFLILCERGLVSMRSLAEEVDYLTEDSNVRSVRRFLYCFPLHDGGPRTMHCGSPYHDYEPFDGALTWLATVIARGCCHEPGKIFELLNFLGVFGHASTKTFTSCFRDDRYESTWDCNLKNGARKAHSNRPLVGYFGNWLPQGLGYDMDQYPEKITAQLKKFWRTEAIFKYWKQVPDEYLVEEKRQASYLTPGNEPRREYLGRQLPPKPEVLVDERITPEPEDPLNFIFELDWFNSAI